MSDLIDRLRGKWEWPPSDIMEEAADEIDRLQAEVERLREFVLFVVADAIDGRENVVFGA